MAPHLTLCFVAFSCLIFNTHAILPPFPKLSEILVEFYQTEVQVTNLDQKITAYAKEYFDNTTPRGRVDLTVVGNKQSVFYNNDTNEVFDVNSTYCKVTDIETSDYDYMPLFYGWLNKNPIVIGPSAAIWYAQNNRDKTMYIGNEFLIRDIKCEAWKLDILGDRDNVTLTFYFADPKWTTPYGVEGLRIPVRIEARGISSAVSESADEWAAVNQFTDFAYFRPSITDWRAFQPPDGLGCFGRKTSLDIPKIPKVFKFAAEVYDLINAENHAEADIEYHQVWYDYNRQIARLDRFNRIMYTSELYDFNTGVTYSNKNDQTCKIQPLRNSFFETYFTHAIVGHFKEPEAVLNLDGDFYYTGKKLMRGIWSDVFESVDYDTIYETTPLKKLVVTAYFSQDYYKVAVKGEEESRIPVFIQIRGSNYTDDLVINVQFNIFAFDDVIWPDMYESFQLARCFPSMQEKSYFILMMRVETQLATAMEGQDEAVIELLRRQISKHAKISDMRIPLLTADYKSSGVYVTGLMLDRPPALKQFWMEFEGDAKPRDNYLKPAIDADTQEKCAMACIKDNDMTCLGFFWCNEACYLHSKDILEDTSDDDKVWEIGICQTWIRAERNSLGSEPYLVDAIKNLEDAVLAQLVNITVQVDATSEAIVPVSDIVIGDGPYTGDGNQEKPYDVVISFAKLKADDETTQEVDYIDTLNDCYKACKDAESIDCSSFSYCPEADNKQCKLSSRLVIDRKANPEDTVDDRNCYVYSLKYLDFYTAYPGRSVLVSGEEVIKNLKSSEACAKSCRSATKFNCRGFEYCRSSQTCVLHTKHVMDLKPGQISDGNKKSTCTHYAAKYVADYYDMGYTLITDDSNQRTELSLEECARTCSEELKGDCKSFNYCPASGPYMTDSTCSPSKLVLVDRNIKTTTKDKCHHFEKKKLVDDWAKVNVLKYDSGSGYTSKGFTGLVIAMLALGLVLGAIGFVGFSYYKSRNHGEGMTVRFMKSDI